MSEPVFLTADELASRWRVTKRTLYNWEKEHPERIPKPFKKPGSATLYRIADVIEIENKLIGE